ncbi:helix-turn-helix transcriptional regulator [Nakamurella lactea]|uniref:helix-turn-helix transcriptional regulator n=1 Tax=Nakamurella lactea TaxID=459515 RepID=UPI00040F780E|nr:YafY family protein [Nakamurella lactea]
MARTAGRTLDLLGLLQTHRDWTGAELCGRLEVSDRTLRRDVQYLRELGYGIDSLPGVGGGYRLGAGASIPPLVLSADEAVAIAIGLRAAATSVVTGIEEAAFGALAKLEGSLSSATRHRISTLERAMVPLGGSAGDPVDMDVVVTVSQAIRDGRRLRIEYRRHDGEQVRRTVEPHRIVHTPRRWYLVAWDSDRRDWRTLRLDRLTPRLPFADSFTPREIPDDAVRSFATRSLSTAPYPFRCTVIVNAPAAAVSRKFGPTVAEVTERDDGTSLLTAGANSPEEFATYLGSSGLDFEVVEPEALRVSLRALAERLTRAADRTS